MNVDEFEKYARDLAYRSVHSFALLSFSTLALNIQFSTGFGKNFLPVLFVAWFSLLVACVAGSWIVMKMPVFYRINAGRLRIENYLSTLNNPQFSQAVRVGTAQTPSGERWSVQMLEQTVQSETSKIEVATKNMDKISDKLPLAHKIQTWSYLAGITLNLIFVIKNLC